MIAAWLSVERNGVGTANRQRTNRAFEDGPQQHPLWFWGRGFAAPINTELYDAQGSEGNAKESAPK
jgi:hypothetical protein